MTVRAPRDLRPLHALLHPLWLTALLVLVTNDHLLKHTGLAGAVTGKLSDVAGLVVAPMLLAALLGARTRRGLVLAHLATGLGFAAIQLPAVAVGWDQLTATLGLPWSTTPDPTDWAALPALAASWWGLVPAAARPLRGVQRVAARLGAGVGLVACCATSSVGTPLPAPPAGLTYADIVAQVWLHNDTTSPRTIRLRQLRAEVVLDCERLLADDPGVLLTDDLFEPEVVWELPSGTTVSALEGAHVSRNGCHAVWLTGDDLEAHVLVWSARAPETVPGWTQAGETHPWGRVAVPDLDDPHGVAWEVGAPRTGECAPQPDLDRLEWALPFDGEVELVDVVPSPDGCLALELRTPGDADTAYVCMPEDRFPFVAGDRLDLTDGDSLTISRADGTVLTLLHPTLDHVVDGLGLVVADDPAACAPAVADCGQVVTDAGVYVTTPEGEEVWLVADASKTWEIDDRRQIVEVMRAERRLVADAACPVGPPTTGFDTDVLVLTEPLSDAIPTE